MLWLPVILCSQFLTDGGQSQITRAVIPAALLHTQARDKQKEHTAVQYIQTEETRWQWESIMVRWLRPQTLGVSVRVQEGHSQLPRWRRNLLECCGSCWVQTDASRWRWRACGQSIGSPFAYQCHGVLSTAGQYLTQVEPRNRVKNENMVPTMTLIWNCQIFPWSSVTTLEQFHDLKNGFLTSCAVFQLRERNELPGHWFPHLSLLWECGHKM